MSTSLLYHAFGTRGYQDVRTTYTGGQVIFTIRQEPETCCCSACGSDDVVARGHVERRFRSRPIGLRTTSLVLPLPRAECRACGVVRQVDITFADPRRSYTKAFERYVLELSRRMTIRDVAAHLNVGWDLVGSSGKSARHCRADVSRCEMALILLCQIVPVLSDMAYSAIKTPRFRPRLFPIKPKTG